MKALVTGGGGFLGSAIARQLRARGDSVRSLSRGDYPALRALGIETIRGDLADPSTVLKAAEGCDTIFHVAARAGIWGPYDAYYQANVAGTRHVLSACRALGVPRLVHTSSPSVVFNGRDMEGADESVPYARHFESFYPATKAEAERLVLSASDATLATVALRPHLIWGPGDNHLIPRIVARARSGRLRRISGPPKLVDTIYIDDAAAAHLQAADRLHPGSAVAGKAYFLSQGEPVPLWELVDRILEAHGLPPVRRSISPRAAVLAGTVCETLFRTLHLPGEPPMTRFLAHQLSTAHWFDISAARRDLGYTPRLTIAEALARLKDSLLSPASA